MPYKPLRSIIEGFVALGIQQWHLTTGFSRSLNEKDELSFVLMYSPTNKVSGVNPLNPSERIELEMYELSFQLA